MNVVRQVAIKKYNIKYTPSTRLADFYAQIPPEVQWPGDNFNNLMEQPTQFYAIALVMAVLGDDSWGSALLAWSYVGLRVAHSLIHGTVNNVTARGRIVSWSSKLERPCANVKYDVSIL